MKTIFNFGDMHKNFEHIAKKILGKYKTYQIPITNNKAFYNDNIQIIDACYGPSTVLDSLSMLKIMGKIKEDDKIVFVGSMGSLTNKIDLNDIAIPTEICCNYFGYNRKVLNPSQDILGKLIAVLNKQKIEFKTYKHGSAMAVFDPHTNHKTYTSSLYDKSILGLDCCEAYIGTNFCNENNIKNATLLYCSDDPTKHITNLSKKEFDARASRFDKLLNKWAYQTLME